MHEMSSTPRRNSFRRPSSSVKKHICDYSGCGKSFSRRFTLTEHIKTHTGDRPYACLEPGCGSRFSTSGNLSRHRKVHLSIRPFKCHANGCTQMFATPAKLARHEKTHTRSQVYRCTEPGCDKVFTTSGNLTRHKKSHSKRRSKEESPMPIRLPTPTRSCYAHFEQQLPSLKKKMKRRATTSDLEIKLGMFKDFVIPPISQRQDALLDPTPSSLSIDESIFETEGKRDGKRLDHFPILYAPPPIARKAKLSPEKSGIEHLLYSSDDESSIDPPPTQTQKREMDQAQALADSFLSFADSPPKDGKKQENQGAQVA